MAAPRPGHKHVLAPGIGYNVNNRVISIEAATRARLEASRSYDDDDDEGNGSGSEDGSHDAPIDVLDLPQLHTHPSGDTLLATLKRLVLKPATFNQGNTKQLSIADTEGLTRYLTGILKSDLSWIEDESIQEQITEEASSRISQRAGRNAMSDVIRAFNVTVCRKRQLDHLDKPYCTGYCQIKIREPSLTGDSLGHKTWGTANVLARRLWDLGLSKDLPIIREQFLKHEPGLPAELQWIENYHSLLHKMEITPPASEEELKEECRELNQRSFTEVCPVSVCPVCSVGSDEGHTSANTYSLQYDHFGVHKREDLKVLELGSGTGLAGIAVAAVWPFVHVTCSDLPEMVENLKYNIAQNEATRKTSNPVEAIELDWSKVPHVESAHHRFLENHNFIMIAADPLYSEEHPALLANCVATYLAKDTCARFIMAYPVREDYTEKLVEEFGKQMNDRGFNLMAQQAAKGGEEWGLINCWIQIYRWNPICCCKPPPPREETGETDSPGQEPPMASVSAERENLEAGSPEDEVVGVVPRLLRRCCCCFNFT